MAFQLFIAWTTCLPFFSMLSENVFGEESATGFRIDKRVPWTMSRIQGTPDPPDPYRLSVAFPKLRFSSPIDLTLVPDGKRLAIVEHKKGISTFPAIGDPAKAELLLDTSQMGQLFAAAFHPEFSKTGWVFFSYIDDAAVHLARVECTRGRGAPRADPASLTEIYRWPKGGHSGGCVRFGPDGYLYLATGDGSAHSDTNLYAQDISDSRGAILRFDVDGTDGPKPYRIPSDNPFLDSANALPEVYAYGLRQPWKMSFDKKGRLWAGEVGQDLWEMVHLIQKGGNYGWSLNEGGHPFRPERKRGPSAIIPPIVEHHHTEFRSLTGGHVYDSPRLAELQGAYIYGDFDTGRISMLRYDGNKVAAQKSLVSSQVRVVGFGQDSAGEVYVVGYASGRIYRLERNPAANREQPRFPRKLSETGLFSSTPEHRIAPGVTPFEINSPAYADGAEVQRFLGLPGESQIEFDALVYPPGPFAAPGWRFPNNSVLVQTFAIPQPDGQPARRIETRVLHHQRMPGSDDQYGAQIWRGYTYAWNEGQTDAELVDAGGADREITIVDPKSGKRQTRSWHIPSRSECAACHNIAAKHVIGMNTMQMNRMHHYGDVAANQLDVFARLKLFDKPLPAPASELSKLPDYRDRNVGVAERARAYLHANCSHCHRQWGGGNSSFQLMAKMPLKEMGIVGARPAHGAFGIAGAQVVSPGAPEHSAMLYRVLSIGSARMPRLGATTVDVQGAQLIRNWIAALNKDQTTIQQLSLPLELLGETASETQAATVDAWLNETPRAIRLVQAIDSGEFAEPVRDLIIKRSIASGDSLVRDLFDRFVPKHLRLKRLGDEIKADAILAMTGEIQNGRRLFFESKTLQCRNCHQIGGQGTALGPELTHIAKMKDARQILESIIQPSKEVKAEYQVVLVETIDGRVISGLRQPNTGTDIVLKDAKNKTTRLRADQVAQLRPQAKSIMPDAQVRSLTAQQLADLVAYLSSLK